MSAKKPSTKTISQQLVEFEALVAWFDQDDFSLEEAVNKYKQAEKLAKSIEAQLNGVKNEITILKQKSDNIDD